MAQITFQSHTRANRRSDSGEADQPCGARRSNPTLGQIGVPTLIKDANKLSHRRVPIPHSGKSAFRQDDIGHRDRQEEMFQSHTRANRRSDAAVIISHIGSIAVPIPHSGKSAFRHKARLSLRYHFNSSNPTLGQIGVPTVFVHFMDFYWGRFQSHTRANRRSDSGSISVSSMSRSRSNPTLGQIGVPTLFLVFWRLLKLGSNPTLGQIGVPTFSNKELAYSRELVPIPHSGKSAFRPNSFSNSPWLPPVFQSHTRANRRSDVSLPNGAYPRSPCSNPTLGQIGVPTLHAATTRTRYD